MKTAKNQKLNQCFLVIMGPIGSSLDLYPKAVDGGSLAGRGWRSLRLGGSWWFLGCRVDATIFRLGDRGPGIDQVQHYNTITQGQEDGIPKT